MGIKQLLDRNPIILLVTTSVAVGSVIAGIMTYFADQKISAMEEREKAKLSELSAKHTSQLSEVSSSLKEKIADLSFKLTSIRTSIPGTEPTYLDITKVVIGRESVKTLATKYKKFWDGDFYLNAPYLETWSMSETNELEVYRLLYGEEFVSGMAEALATLLKEAKVLMWRRNSAASINTKVMGEKVTLSYYPMIYIQKFGKSDISKRATVMFQVLSDTDEKNADEVNARISTVNKDITSMTPDAGGPATDKQAGDSDVPAGVAAPTAVSDAEKSKDRAESKEKIVEKLSAVYSADLASFVMADTIISRMNQGSGNYRVFSAQKKGNVLYLQAQESFAISDPKTGSRSQIDVDQETFYFSIGENGLLVRVFLPEIEGRSDDVAWTRSWLAGLQIPLSP
jgi:hypothetical protein